MQSLFTASEFVLKYPKIYGIATSLRHLKLGYVLITHADFDVVYEKEIFNFNRESEHQAYLLTYLDDDTQLLVIKNKGTQQYFYPKYKQVDYLLCSISEDEINIEIVKIVSKLKGISICFALDNPNKKDLLNFTQLQ
ncbi:MAG: hypothetical protein ABF321_05525 [Bacteroidia bacterium]|jgi:hypothetical protein